MRLPSAEPPLPSLHDPIFGEVRLARARLDEASPEVPGWEPLALDPALRVVGRCARQSPARRTLAGPAVRGSWSSESTLPPFEARLAQALRRGEMVLLTRPRSWGSSPGAPTPRPVPPAKPPPTTLRTWVGVRLIDAQRRPVAGIPVVVVDPAGASHALVTNEGGEARVDGIDPGVCDLVLPTIDGRDWGPAGPSEEGDLRLEVSEHPHSVQDGECLSSLARAKGFLRLHALLRHPANAELFAARQNPNVLAPGDLLTIPDRLARVEPGGTGAQHTFILSAPSVLLRLRLQAASPPWSTYALSVEGLEVARGELAAEATDVVAPIEHGARTAILTLAGDSRSERVLLSLGELDPWDSPLGWQARLRNLGYPLPLAATPGQQRRALSLFQREAGLVVDGEPGPATTTALRAAHGC